MDKIDATIKGNAKLADKITKGFVYVTDFSLIGGASNHWEGKSVTPERKMIVKGIIVENPMTKIPSLLNLRKIKL